MRYSIRTVTPANLVPLPFDLDAAKAHLNVEHADDDALIAAQVAAAVRHVEAFTSQVLSPRVMEAVYDGFPLLPDLIELPRAPVTAIVSVTYADPSTGADVVWDAGEWRWSDSSPELLRPSFGGSWPSAAAERGSVRVRFDAGYEEGLAPGDLIAAAKLILGHLYANRESVVTGTIATQVPGVQDLMRPYRRVLL